MYRLTKVFRGSFVTSVLFCCLVNISSAQTGPIRTAVDATFAPHAMPKLGGGIQGFNVEMGQEIAKRLGREMVIEAAEFSGLVPGLNSKRYDFLIAPVTVTPERAKSLLFTEGYLDTDYTFLGSQKSPPITNLTQLQNKIVSVNKGSNYEGWARDNANQYGFRFEVYGTNADAVQAVQAGRADYNLAGTTVVAWAAKKNPSLKTSYTIKTGLVWAIAFRKNDNEGRAKISNVLKCMKKDGTLSTLAKKWFGFEPDATNSAVKIDPGTGVPDMDGYDATPVVPTC